MIKIFAFNKTNAILSDPTLNPITLDRGMCMYICDTEAELPIISRSQVGDLAYTKDTQHLFFRQDTMWSKIK